MGLNCSSNCWNCYLRKIALAQLLRVIPVPPITIAVNVGLTVAFLFDLYSYDPEKISKEISEKYLKEAYKLIQEN